MKPQPIDKSQYVARVLYLYLRLAETPTKYSRIDQRLAGELYDKQIALGEVEGAMILATARRLLRSPDAPKLGPIRSLHYFLPLIEEIRSTPISEEYFRYLRHRLATLEQKGQIRPPYKI
jgi:hypothetical protein